MINKIALVIDDDEGVRDSLRMLLEFKNFIVECCDRGEPALDHSNTKPFDLILVDYHMPAMNGAVITRQLRAFCPTAFIIGMSMEEQGDFFYRAGADAFINKNHLVHDLVSIIDHEWGPASSDGGVQISESSHRRQRGYRKAGGS